MSDAVASPPLPNIGTVRGRKLIEGGCLLFLCGVSWGLIVPLSRSVALQQPHPLGLALWINILGACACLVVAVCRGSLPRIGKREIAFFVGWAVLYALVNQVVVYWLARHVPGAILSVVIILEGLVVFAISAVAGLEAATYRRLLGLLVGLAGVGTLLMSGAAAGAGATLLWLAASLAVPVTYAAETFYIARWKPPEINGVASMGIMMSLGAVILFPFAAGTGDLLPLSFGPGNVELCVIGMTAATVTANVLFIRLVARTGAVFAGQSSYAVALAGIIWSVLLLGESLTSWIVVALALVVCGLVMVGVKEDSSHLASENSLE